MKMAKNGTTKAIPTISDEEIRKQPLLSRSQQKICRELRDLASKERQPFTMLDFSRIALRATARESVFANNDDGDSDSGRAAVLWWDLEMRRAAALYVFEELARVLPAFARKTKDDRLQDCATVHRLLVAGLLYLEQAKIAKRAKRSARTRRHTHKRR